MKSDRCKVCKHPKCVEIDTALLQGVPYTELAARYGMSTASISRHVRNDHIPKELMVAEGAKEVVDANTVWTSMAKIEDRLNEILGRATKQKKASVEIAALKELREMVKLKAQVAHYMKASLPISGEIDFDTLISGIKNWLQKHYPEVYEELVCFLYQEYQKEHPEASVPQQCL